MADESNGTIQEGLDDLRARVLHLLEVYPYISKAMIQVGLGPATSPKFWHPVLTELCEQGKVKMVETTVASPGGRALSKSIYHLPKYPYPPVPVQEMEAESTATAEVVVNVV